ncbi:MAG: leucine-rich repeat protein [Clostridia bacterium]|nr:leucine-rich repeat protein [Clostridia bacterium]
MKNKEEKQFKGMTAPVEVSLDIPENEIWTYQIEGLAAPHINKPFTNFKIKKIVFTVLILIAVLLSMYFSVRVVSREPFEFTASENGYEFTKFNNTGYIYELDIDYATELVTKTDVADPEKNFELVKDETKPVTSIAKFCFNCDEVVEVIRIGKDVKEIDGTSFYTCRALKQIIVDEENEYFCDIDGVLYNKDKTEIICYPMNHPAYLREKYGYNDTIWPDNSEFYASYKAQVLTYVLPETVEKIGKLCFADTAIAAIYMPEGLKTIETMAMFKCWYLSDIYSYESSTAGDITDYSAIKMLSGVYRSLPDGLEYIGSDAMSYDRSSDFLRIPATVTYIGHHAFWDTVYKDGDKFEGNEKIYIAASEEEFKSVETGDQWIPTYDSGLFNKKVELVYNTPKRADELAQYTQKEDGTYELTSFINTELLTEVTINNALVVENGEVKEDTSKKVTSLGAYPFKWDNYIETVYIGKDVAQLDGNAFFNLRALKKIIVDKDNENYCDIDGVLYTKDMTVLLHFPAAYEKCDTYVVPSTVTKIARAAFCYSDIKTIYFPEGLKEIDNLAFLKAEKLEKIYSYKADKEVLVTDESAVAQLSKVYESLPEGIERIGLDGFNYASSLTYLYIPSSIKNLDGYCFCYNAYVDANGNKAGITEVNVALSETEFKSVTKGDHWLPEFRNESNDTATINFDAKR